MAKQRTENRVWVSVRTSGGKSVRAWLVACGALQCMCGTKADAVEMAVALCRQIEASGGKASLSIGKSNGRFCEERTYPRSSDPRSRPG